MRPRPDFAPFATAPVLAASERYIKELDGIRALAVGIVVSAHYQLVPYTPGGFGVTLFFFLSGYLITTLFFAEFHSTLNISIQKFYMRRWLRLTPPLVISVGLATVFYRISCHAVGGHPVPAGTAMAALLYYTNYYDLSWGMADAKVIPFGICWSLAIEEHFYLLWPLLIRINIQTPKRLFIIITILCVGVLIWRLVARYGLVLSSDYTYMATDCRIDSILYGAMLRVLFEMPRVSVAVRLLRSSMCQILALVILVITFIIRDENFRQTFRYTLQGFALLPLFTAVLSNDPQSLVRKGLASPPMVLIGRLSYSIYLFHLLARTPGEVYLGSLGATISGLVLTAAIAYTLFVFVERPIAELRHRLRARAASARSETTIAMTEPAIATVPQERTRGV